MRLTFLIFSFLSFLILNPILAQERFNKEIVSKTQTVNSECTNCPILISQTIATEPGLRN